MIQNWKQRDLIILLNNFTIEELKNKNIFIVYKNKVKNKFVSLFYYYLSDIFVWFYYRKQLNLILNEFIQYQSILFFINTEYKLLLYFKIQFDICCIEVVSKCKQKDTVIEM